MSSSTSCAPAAGRRPDPSPAPRAELFRGTTRLSALVRRQIGRRYVRPSTVTAPRRRVPRAPAVTTANAARRALLAETRVATHPPRIAPNGTVATAPTSIGQGGSPENPVAPRLSL